MTDIGRRSFVLGGASAIAMAAMGHARAGEPSQTREPDVHIELRAAEDVVSIRMGPGTPVWRYQARLVRGPADTLTSIPGSYLAPVLRLRKGQRVRVTFDNHVDEPSTIHWHGLLVPDAMDGHPRHAVLPGKRYVYEFNVINRAGTYWFHPHPHGRTGPQVYWGLAGLFIVHDDEEAALTMPRPEFEIPLVIQDRIFGADNRLLYPAGRMGGMMSAMSGVIGDTILANGLPHFMREVRAQPYRLRILNGSNASIYRLALTDNKPFMVVASDGGLLDAPIERRAVAMGPGERLDLWIDFSGYAKGASIVLAATQLGAASSMMGPGMMGRGMMGRGGGIGPSSTNGRAAPIARFEVGSGATDRRPLPARLSPAGGQRIDTIQRVRRFALTQNHMRWGINQRTFEMTRVADDETVRLGATEAWEFANAGNMMMAMPHPMHVHAVQFRVIERIGSRYAPDIARDLVDAGLKDTVLVLPGERVRVAMRFDAHPGLFLYHCHNLEHGDAGMMRNFLIRA